MSRTSCPCCRRGAKPTAAPWMQRGLSPSLRQASQTGFRLFAHKCCSPTHTSVCTPRVHSSGCMKCRYSHQQNLHTLPALLILMRTKETFEIPRKGTFQEFDIAYLVQTKCYSLHLPLQCSIWGCTCIYYFIEGNKHKLGVKIISLWQSSNLYVRGTILQTHLYSQHGKKLLEERALEIKPWMLQI